MNLYSLLQQREADDQPVRVGLIGAGKFGAMYLSQVLRTPGVHMVGIADLDPPRVRETLSVVGWPAEQYQAATLDEAQKNRGTAIIEDALQLISHPGTDIIIDATGHAAAGITHVLACCEHGKDIVMVNVEADALAGPALAEKARAAGIVYSLAYGDQPALICESVDWARAAGFEVVAAGKGTKYLPVYHQSTPDDVWGYYGITPEDALKGRMNPQMFNSFLDGTKSSIEMAAVANATGLEAPQDGLAFPACGTDDLANLLKPREEGGVLDKRGQVEVVSSIERDQRAVFRDLRWGVYCTFAADSDYVRRCFQEYGLLTDSTGNYSAMYKPYHLIGLELGISVASVALRREPTGTPLQWQADVVAVAKRDLAIGERLDGEGGYRVWGRLMPATQSLAVKGLPLGLAQGVKLKRAVAAGQSLAWDDVDIDQSDPAVAFRRQMEASSIS